MASSRAITTVIQHGAQQNKLTNPIVLATTFRGENIGGTGVMHPQPFPQGMLGAEHINPLSIGGPTTHCSHRHISLFEQI